MGIYLLSLSHKTTPLAVRLHGKGKASGFGGIAGIWMDRRGGGAFYLQQNGDLLSWLR